MREIAVALRVLRKDPGFTATALITLAVCIAANTAIFTIVQSVVLRPLPFPDSARILLMSNQYPKAGMTVSNVSAGADYYDRLRDTNVFTEQAIFSRVNRTIEMEGVPQQVSGMRATPSLMRLLQTSPVRGRAFQDSEGEMGQDRRVILSHALWRQMFHADPGVIGREIRLSGTSHTIVGIMPQGFQFMDDEARFWIPLALDAEEKKAHHSNNHYNIGRLKPGASAAQAQSQIDAINAANMEREPQFKPILLAAGFHTRVEPLRDVLIRDFRGVLYLLWAGAGFVLLIGVLNIANLTMARIRNRSRDLAVRLALGAGPGQVLRQLIVEHVLVALGAGILGIGLAAALLRALASFGLDRLPRAAEVQMDGSVLALAVLASVVVGLAMGLMPVAAIRGMAVNGTLREEGRSGTASRGTRWVRGSLVVAQVAFAFILLAGAGLLLASFRELLRVDPGFRTSGVMTASVSPARSRYPEARHRRELVDRSLREIRSIPGVEAAGVTSMIPLSGAASDSVVIPEGYVMKPGESLVSPLQIRVSAGYFEAIGIQLRSGRLFDERDTEDRPRVAIIDERLAHNFWPGADPVGKRMYFPQDVKNLLKTDETTVWIRVVGVARNVQSEDLGGRGMHTAGTYYFPFAQQPNADWSYAVRSAVGSQSAAAAIRQKMLSVDSSLALYDIRDINGWINRSLASRKASMLLALAFGTLALFLSAIGVYGVLAYIVAQRRKEIGIRVALGSTHAGIFGLVLRDGMALVLTGAVLGGLGAFATRKALEAHVFGVSTFDPAVLGIVTAGLFVAALAACAAPARRAMKVDPIRALTE